MPTAHSMRSVCTLGQLFPSVAAKTNSFSTNQLSEPDGGFRRVITLPSKIWEERLLTQKGSHVLHFKTVAWLVCVIYLPSTWLEIYVVLQCMCVNLCMSVYIQRCVCVRVRACVCTCLNGFVCFRVCVFMCALLPICGYIFVLKEREFYTRGAQLLPSLFYYVLFLNVMLSAFTFFSYLYLANSIRPKILLCKYLFTFFSLFSCIISYIL